MAKAIHAMIRVLDEARSVGFYKRAFNLDLVDRFAFDSFTLLYLRNKEAAFELELTVNHGRSEPYRPGDGYGHMAFSVEDVAAEHVRFERERFAPQPIKEFLHEGRMLARFFFVQDPDGYRIEVMQRQGRFR